MITKLIPALAALFLLLLFIRWFTRTPPEKVARTMRRGLLYLAIGLLVVLAVTGRLHWLLAAIGTLFAFLPRLLSLIRYVPLAGQLYKRYKAARSASAGATPGQTSQVEARLVRMSLNHETGEIDGVVLDGSFKGSRLSELSMDQLIELWRDCNAQDEESGRLVQAFLDRMHGTAWHERAGGAQANDTGTAGAAAPGGPMSRNEAYEILGLEPDAGEEEIVHAHRRLIQKLHPDRGGSGYLAAKINQAKDLLLGG